MKNSNVILNTGKYIADNEFIISIIIPVYNVKDYIKRCAVSVFEQVTNYAFEVIFVDDGSTDGSGDICNSFKNRTNVKVIHQQNEGLSKARNVGISHANGKYIMFLDSDDYICNDAVEHFGQIAIEYAPDVIVGKAKVITDDGAERDKLKYSLKSGLYNRKDYLEKLNQNHDYSACAPFSLYKKSFIELKKLSFCEGVIYEDELWTLNVLLTADTFFYSNFVFYYNYRRNDSITQNSENEYASNSLKKIVIKMLKICRDNEQDSIDVFNDRIVSLFFLGLCKAKDYKDYCRYFDRFMLLKISTNVKTRVMSALYMLSPRLYLFIHKLIKGF